MIMNLDRYLYISLHNPCLQNHKIAQHIHIHSSKCHKNLHILQQHCLYLQVNLLRFWLFFQTLCQVQREQSQTYLHQLPKHWEEWAGQTHPRQSKISFFKIWKFQKYWDFRKICYSCLEIDFFLSNRSESWFNLDDWLFLWSWQGFKWSWFRFSINHCLLLGRGSWGHRSRFIRDKTWNGWNRLGKG